MIPLASDQVPSIYIVNQRKLDDDICTLGIIYRCNTSLTKMSSAAVGGEELLIFSPFASESSSRDIALGPGKSKSGFCPLSRHSVTKSSCSGMKLYPVFTVHFFSTNGISGTVDNDFLLLSLGCCNISIDVDVSINCSGNDVHTHSSGCLLHPSHTGLPTRDRSTSLRSVLATLLAIFVFILASYCCCCCFIENEYTILCCKCSANSSKKQTDSVGYMYRPLPLSIL